MPVLEYQAPEGDLHRSSTAARVLAALTCMIGVAGNIGAMLAATTLWRVPPGTMIRPMGLYALLLLIAFCTAATGLPIGIMGIIHGKLHRRVWVLALVGMLLCLAPMFSSGLVIDAIVHWHGLQMAP